MINSWTSGHIYTENIPLYSANSMIYGIIIIIVLYEMSRVLLKQSFEITYNIITRGLCTFQVLFIIITVM